MKTSPKKLNVISSAEYKISVVGFLDENMSDRLGGLTILNTEPEQNLAAPIVTLTGKLTDQAALFGVLNALYNMRFPLLSVEYLGDSEMKGKNHEK
jgi:hypothetical protein